jgi:hypothetical protein
MPTINPVLDAYFHDQSIDPTKKANLARDLDSKKIDEAGAVNILTKKYPHLSGTSPAVIKTPIIPTSGANPEKLPDTMNKGAGLEGLDPSSPEFIKKRQEFLSKGASPGSEFGSPKESIIPQVVNDTFKGVSEGAGKIYGAGSDLGYAFTGIDENGKQLAPDERAIKFGNALINTAGGALESIFALPGAIVKQVPGVNQAVGFGMEKVKEGSDAVANRYMEKTGIDPNSEQGKAITEGMNVLSQLLVAKGGENIAEFKAAEAAKAKSLGEIRAADLAGDMAAKAEAISKYEAEVAKGPSKGQVLGPIASAAGAVVSTAAGGVWEGVKGLKDLGVKGAKATADILNKPVDLGNNAGFFDSIKSPEARTKAIDALEEDYHRWSGATKSGVKNMNKTEARTTKLNASGTEGKTPQRILAENGIIPETQGTKFSTAQQAAKFREKIQPLTDTQTEALKLAEKVTPPMKVDTLMQEAIDQVRTKENIASGKAAKLEAEIKREFETYKKEYGEEVSISTINEIKSARWKDTRFDFSQPLKSDTNYAIAKAAQKSVENIAEKAGLRDIAQLNREIGDGLEAAKYLESLDGQTLKFGKLGKYIFSGVGASLATSLPGKILGFIGGEVVADILMKADVANPIKRAILKQIKIKDPAGYQQVVEWMQSPEAQQRLLPAPKEGVTYKGNQTVHINPTIEMAPSIPNIERMNPEVGGKHFAREAQRKVDAESGSLLPAPREGTQPGSRIPIELPSRSLSTKEASEKARLEKQGAIKQRPSPNPMEGYEPPAKISKQQWKDSQSRPKLKPKVKGRSIKIKK